MSAALLARARGLGIRVAEERGGLRVEGSALTDELVAEIRAAKGEVLALLRREAAEARAPEPANAGPASGTCGPWSWVTPDAGPEDLALLRAIDRIDQERSEPLTVWPCYGCGARDWWRARIGGHLVCRRCHPPVPGAEATL